MTNYDQYPAEDSVDVVVKGPDLDVGELLRDSRALAFSYLETLRHMHSIHPEEVLRLQVESLPDVDGHTVSLGISSDTAEHVRVLFGRDSDKQNEIELRTDDPLPEKGNEELPAARARAVKNALYDAMKRGMRGEPS